MKFGKYKKEVAFHLSNIAHKRHISTTQEQEALQTLNNLKILVAQIEADIYQDFKQDALIRIGIYVHK